MTAHRSFRELFDLDPSLTYLNSGTHSICPTRVTDEVIRHLRAFERNPTANLAGVWPKLWASQQALARYLGARPEDLILRPSVTSAMNAFLMTIPLAHGSGEILVSDGEYGAIANICRFRAERDGLSLRAFHLPGWTAELAHATEDSLVDCVLRELRPETRILVLSHVITGNGLRLPIERIAHETRKRGVLFAVDGAHATGAIEMDFARLEDVDFYAGNLHKWVMGPKGTGFGWRSPRHQDALQPLEAGWTTFAPHPPHTGFAPGHTNTQRLLNAASIDFAPWLALPEVFKLWSELGADAVRARLGALQACVEREMRNQVGWNLLASPDLKLRGPLLAYELPQAFEAEGYGFMFRFYEKHRIQVASSMLQGRWVLRISPHIYNTEEEIAHAARAIAELARAP